ncbi:colanic acid transporter [Pseudoalteromonas sp. MSK9-3]|uniref:MOP flippase family protein n=1 Tax=Pseudoalteromonas sp. MSK9-3 TaxID=1897633 RepID=UPI000E6C404A|nr:MOP flippase family protein [Pseudoalteromonas sp. MSK9-3]RJE76918.1 colanic acid transporter [Pseudoalteromonas sp. MSK9-3]
MTALHSALRGISWVALSTFSKGGLQLAQLIILARYLTPLELGVAAILNLVIGFTQVFGDAGLSNAVIYHTKLTDNQLGQLYVINVTLGVILTISLVLLSDLIAVFFSMPLLSELLCVLASVFFIRSLSQQILARLQQKMHFDMIAKVDISAQLLGFLAVILAVYYEAGIWSLVIGQFVLVICSSMLLFIVGAQYITRPKCIVWPQIKEPVKYGLYQCGEALINFSSAQVDQVLVGKLLGPEKLGVYAYIKDLVFKPALQLINPIVNKVAFPVMVNFKEGNAIHGMYLSMLKVLSLINIPLYGLMAAFPEVILEVTFGEKWVEHSAVLQWLALYMLAIALVNPVGVLLRAVGRVKRAFWWNIVVAFIRPAVLFTTVSTGVIGLAFTLFCLQVLFFIAHVQFLLKPCAHVGFRDVYFALRLPLIVVTLVVSTALFMVNYGPLEKSIFLLISTLIMCLLLMSPSILSNIKSLRK